jgi:hypothetical protein
MKSMSKNNVSLKTHVSTHIFNTIIPKFTRLDSEIYVFTFRNLLRQFRNLGPTT